MSLPPRKNIKDVSEVVACCIDYGTFLCVAEKLAERMKTVYYYSPYEHEYEDINFCMQGVGLDKVRRLDNFLDPEVFDTIDLFVFPDIEFGGLQKHLRSLGKAVWGQMGGGDLELDRDLFLKVLNDVDLPMVPSERVVGMSALREYLMENENKWVKINRYRRNMETWHHLDYAHSERRLDSMEVTFGGAKEAVVFIVQDDIESDIETGYDGWCVDGQFPSASFQGYEKKNELYLGAVLSNAALADEIKIVNERMAPVLASYGYRDWWATEIRVKDGVPYFIDPTPRMPGMTGEHLLETCENLAEVIWHGANGILIEPKFKWKFAAEAMLHYDGLTADDAVRKEWRTLDLPEETLPWLKLVHYCKIDGIYQFTPEKEDEFGVVIGVGNTVEESIDHLKDNLDTMSHLPVHANLAGFVDLIESIEQAEAEGVQFGGETPDPKKLVGKVI